MKSDLYHLTKRLQALSLSLNRQHDQGIVDLKKVELIEIYVELIEIMIDLLAEEEETESESSEEEK
tara:strand:+ start:27733 stop:27930 length:198 start_codon:yes stop_codon:yes gene_type:complete